MAVVSTISNHAKHEIVAGNVDFDADSFLVMLMDSAFTFNKDTHNSAKACLANQIASGNGYISGGTALTGVILTEDDANDRASVEWSAVSWTASGGPITEIKAAVIIDDTTTDDTVIGCIDFGTLYTIPDGSSLEIQDITLLLT